MSIIKINKKYLARIVLPATLFFAFTLSAHAQEGVAAFYIDQGQDLSDRTQVDATLYYDGNKAHYYVENDFIQKLSLEGRAELTKYVKSLSDTFDNKIYQNETLVFGLPWTPGIDNDLKITVLLTQMKKGTGGYFRWEDEQPRDKQPDSNQREMLYLNVNIVTYPHLKEFFAHEYQHLINYNQKTRIHGIVDAVWINELMSEAASFITLYDPKSFTYDVSNMRDRARIFMGTPNDALLDWNNSEPDYGGIAILSYYLYEKYGNDFYTSLSFSDKTGLDALNEALQKVGAKKTFRQVYVEWLAAIEENNCQIPSTPTNLYCYTTPDLGPQNLIINFNKFQLGTASIDSQDTTSNWEGNWFRFSRNLQEQNPSDNHLTITFTAPQDGSDFSAKYIVRYKDATKKVFDAPIQKSNGTWSVPDFGYNVDQVDVALANFASTQNTAGNPATVPFELKTALSAAPVSPTVAPQLQQVIEAIDIHEGDLIRALGDSKVYVVHGKYRRWIQSAEIFSFYGNLRWEDIKDVSGMVLNSYTESSLVRLDSSKKVYYVDANGIKQWVETEAAFLDRAFLWDMIYVVNDRELNWFKNGQPIQ